MSKAQEILDLIAQFNDATNEVAKDIAALRQQLADSSTGGGLTQAEAQEVADKLSVAHARLVALGADSDDPVPA